MPAHWSWEVRWDCGHASSLDHLAEVTGYAVHDSFNQFFSLFRRGQRWFFVWLLRPNFRADVFRKRCQCKRRLEFLRLPGQVIGKPMTTLKQLFCVGFSEHIPVGEKLEIDLIQSEELVPCAIDRRDVAAVAIQHQDVFEPSARDAVNEVAEHCQKGS